MILNLFSRRRRLLRQPFPSAWQAVLDRDVFLFRRLPETERERLRDAIKLFVAEKGWEGCDGLAVTDAMRVVVAAHAGLLGLGLDGFHFDHLRTVLLYPDSYLVESDGGLAGGFDGETVREGIDRRLGESHGHGAIVLAWREALWQSRLQGGQNVILHELAHQLAELNERDTGLPPIADPGLAGRWEAVMEAERRHLKEESDRHRPTLLDPYGAESPAELFAVATEAFFLQPERMRQERAELYSVLAAFYRQDPASWPPATPGDRAAAAGAEEKYDRHMIAEHTTAIRLQPDYAESYIARAMAYQRLGEPALALIDLDRYLALQPNDAEGYLERAAVHLDLDDPDSAIADCTRALELLPDYGRAYTGRAEAHLARGNHKAALADLDAALRLDPEDDQAWHQRGIVRSELGKPDAALPDFDQAIRLSPREPTYYVWRADAHSARGDHAAALADIETALGLAPEGDWILEQRGQILLDSDRPAEALADFDQAIARNPEDGLHQAGRAAALNALERFKEAVEAADIAIRLDPGLAQAYEQRGTANRHLKNILGAIYDFTQAIHLDPKSADAYSQRAELYLVIGDSRKAAADRKRAEKLGGRR
jgi:MtfA peptidase